MFPVNKMSFRLAHENEKPEFFNILKFMMKEELKEEQIFLNAIVKDIFENDTRVKKDYQDFYDHILQKRYIEVRSALRDFGWEGEKYGILYDPTKNYSLKPEFEHRGGGNNVVAIAYNVIAKKGLMRFSICIEDIFLLTPVQIAETLTYYCLLNNINDKILKSRVKINSESVDTCSYKKPGYDKIIFNYTSENKYEAENDLYKVTTDCINEEKDLDLKIAVLGDNLINLKKIHEFTEKTYLDNLSAAKDKMKNEAQEDFTNSVDFG